MGTLLNVVLVVLGVVGLYFYYRSIVRVMLVNRREWDLVEQVARFVAVKLCHLFAGDGRDYAQVQRAQAWTLPFFIFIAVTIWFLLVQFSFSLILLGTSAEANWPRAFSSSGSALSTLGFLTPPKLLGEYLAVYEAAIGLAVVVLLFTFVPGYQAAIQVRERKVGWIFTRTGRHPTCMSLIRALHESGRLDDVSFWEDWEAWFRGLLETHSISPILAHVPSVYRGTTWVGAAAVVLDAASIHLSTIESEHSAAVQICRRVGVSALKAIAAAQHGSGSAGAGADHRLDEKLAVSFDRMYEKMIEMRLPLKPDKEQCRQMFVTLRTEYQSSIHRIAKATLMPVDEPWVCPHPDK